MTLGAVSDGPAADHPEDEETGGYRRAALRRLVKIFWRGAPVSPLTGLLIRQDKNGKDSIKFTSFTEIFERKF